MADSKIRRDNDRLSTFLASFPTETHCTENPHKRVFWSQHHDDRIIHDKIKSAFSDLFLPPVKGILQFWSSSGETLSCSDQPFSFSYFNSRHHKYRLTCINYQYNIDQLEVADDPMIISSPPATAFLNRFPQVVVDLTTLKQDSLLVRSALECGLTSSLLLPVFYPSLSSCVGVVECTVKRSCLLIFSRLKSALERVGLTTYNVHDSRPYKGICGLKHVTDEIEKALDITSESHDLALAQVWIAYGNSVERKQVTAFKLIGYLDVSDDTFLSPLKDYYDTCDTLPLKMGEGLAGKTLETYEPHFCRNVYKLNDSGLLTVLSANTRCSCFAICLRSMHTCDIDYVFEFLWPQTRNYLILLDSLLSTLKRYLPSFKFASGAQLGDELRVLDVENSTRSGIGFFTTLQGNRLSHWNKCRNVLGISEWQGPKFLKRKLSDLSDSKNQQNHTTNQESSTNINGGMCLDDDDDDDDDDLLIAATYREKFKVFNHLTSSTLAIVKEKIDEEFHLDPGTYRLEFEFNDGYWTRLNNDKDFTTLVKIWRRAQMSPIEVRVLPASVGQSEYADQHVV